MPTVAEILELDTFKSARVVAGHQGVQKSVVWVHNVGVVDAAEWLNGGELVLVTANNLPTTADEPQTLYA